MNYLFDTYKVKKIIFFVILAVMAAQYWNSYKQSQSMFYRGKRFSMDFPAGWDRTDEDYDTIMYSSEVGSPEIVAFSTPVAKPTDRPEATISATALKLESALWIEDQFIDIIKALHKSGFKIIDKGEVRIEGQLAKWVFVEAPRRKMVVIEFYMIDDGNIFYKIQYSATPRGFSKFRKIFEQSKSTFRFKMAIF